VEVRLERRLAPGAGNGGHRVSVLRAAVDLSRRIDPPCDT
jgi:hypothetical protein